MRLRSRGLEHLRRRSDRGVDRRACRADLAFLEEKCPGSRCWSGCTCSRRSCFRYTEFVGWDGRGGGKKLNVVGWRNEGVVPDQAQWRAVDDERRIEATRYPFRIDVKGATQRGAVGRGAELELVCLEHETRQSAWLPRSRGHELGPVTTSPAVAVRDHFGREPSVGGDPGRSLFFDRGFEVADLGNDDRGDGGLDVVPWTRTR